MMMERYSCAHEVSPPSARALSMATLVDSRGCPLCGNALKGRQRLCSGVCRAKLSRQKKATQQAQRDRRLREMLEEALGALETAIDLILTRS